MRSEPAARRFPTAPPDGIVAAILLSFLATAGFFYVNIMPALIDGLVRGWHFSEAQGGFVASANVYGASAGALFAVLIVRRIAWRPVAVALLLILIGLDLASILVRQVESLAELRFVHGLVGGLLVGISFAVIARTRTPDRVFGVLLVVQFGLGGLGVLLLPRMVAGFGVTPVFIALALFSVVTLAMVPFLAGYPVRGELQRTETRSRIDWGPLGLALAATFLFQAGNMALAAYMIGLGRAYGLDTDLISAVLGAASWVGALGSLLVIVMGTKFGRFWPVLVAFVPTLLGNAAFHMSASAEVFAGANVGTAVTWAFIIPYLLGICASFDKTGQTAALGGFASHMGLATGPLLGGMLLGAGSYPLLINAAVATLCVSAVAALLPAWKLDRRNAPVPSLAGHPT
jgi:MFS transporter, DHA1 family, inner membrane transport protein